MKKIALFCAAALGLGFVSCDGYEEPNAQPQTNPQEAIFASDGVAITPTTATVDLVAADVAGQNVDLGTVALTNFPAGYTLQLVGELSATDNFNGANTFTATGTIAPDSTVVISAAPAALNAVYTANITKAPAENTVKVRYAAYAVKDENQVRVGNPDLYFGPYDVTIKPFNPANIIEDAYYLALSADGLTWPADKAIKMGHSERSPYDDPQFASALSLSSEDVANGLYWMIVPASTYATGDLSGGLWYAPNEEGMFDQKGSLVQLNGPMTEEDIKAGIMLIDGDMLFSINMEEMTFDYIQAVANFWMPGGANGWSFGDPALYTNNFLDYFGYANVDGEFKFSPDAGWMGHDFGSDEGIAFEEVDGVQVGEGTAVGSSNIGVPAAGLYWVTLNYPTRALKMVQITTYGVIGGFNGWAESVALTPSADNMTWTGEITLSEGDEFKFRANNGWDVNLGGENLNDLTQGGPNCKATESGTFTVTLDLSMNPYSATLVKK